MLVCRDADFEKWTPDFSGSGQQNPSWVRVRTQDVELSNALNAIEWRPNPVQVVLCDTCGEPGCASGGYVHVSRLRSTVLWTTPQLGAQDERWACHAVERFGAVAIEASQWARWCVYGVPSPSDIEPANGLVLANAWRMSTRGRSRVGRLDDVVPMLRSRLIATEHHGNEAAIGYVATLVEYLAQISTGVLRGRLERPDAVGATIVTLYFDGPSLEDWDAFALQGSKRA